MVARRAKFFGSCFFSQRIFDAVKPGLYFHGHYHCRYESGLYLPGGDGMKVVGLDMNQSTLADNTYFLGEPRAEWEHELMKAKAA